MKKSMIHLLMLITVTTAGLVISDENSAYAEENAATEKAQAPDAVVSSVKEALSAYGEIQTKLASDSTEGLKEQAAKVQTAATTAQKEAKGKLKPKLKKLAAQAEKFQKLASDAEIAEVRKEFGELSKTVVGVVAEVPSLQDDLHVFKCPMAKGYKKWVQASKNKANPYMGKKMAMCGATADWQI